MTRERVRASVRAVYAKVREERRKRAEGRPEGKQKNPLIPPWASKAFTKAKTWITAPQDLLNTLGRIGPAALAAALGPALRAAAAVGLVGAAAGYVVANEREDEQQITAADLDSRLAPLEDRLGPLEERLDGLDRTVATIPDAPPPTVDLRPEIEELADQLAGLEGVNPDDIARLDTAVAALERRPTASGVGNLAALEDSVAEQEAQLAATSDLLAKTATLDELAVALDTAETGAAQKVAALQAEKDADVAALTDLIDQIGEFDPSSLEAAISALESADVAVASDIAGLEATDTQLTADAEAALDEAIAALAQADAALAAAEAAQADIATAQADLDDIETVFFADLTRQWKSGLPVALAADNGCGGTRTPFSQPGGVWSASNSSVAQGIRNFCVRFAPTAPVLPAACAFSTPTGFVALTYDTPVKTLLATNATSVNTSSFSDTTTDPTSGTSGTFFFTLGTADGSTPKTAPAGSAIAFMPKSLDWTGYSYQLTARIGMASATGSPASVAASTDSVTAKVTGVITCNP